MASVRLGTRNPQRPSAERSPSPDVGTRSIIPSTNSPGIKRRTPVDTPQKDEAITNIRRQNQRLKEEVQKLLAQNKQDALDQSTLRDRTQADPILQETTKKQPSLQAPGASTNWTGGYFMEGEKTRIAGLVLESIKEKEETLYIRIKSMQERLSLVEQENIKLVEKVDAFKKHGSPLSKSQKPSQIESPRRVRKEDFMREGKSISPIKFQTPDKAEAKHQEVVRRLQIQLSSATVTIHRLETILETEERSTSNLKRSTHIRETTLLKLEKQNQALADDLKKAYEVTNRQRQTQSNLNKEISQLKLTIVGLEQRLVVGTSKQPVDPTLKVEQDNQGSWRKELQREVEISRQQLEIEKSTVASLKTENQVLRQKYDQFKNEFQQVSSLATRFKEEKEEVEALTNQLAEALRDIDTFREQRKSQAKSYHSDIKNIRTLIQSIDVPEELQYQEVGDPSRAIQTSAQVYRQQILQMETTVIHLTSQKDSLDASCVRLQEENKTLKEKIKSLEMSIQQYLRPPPASLVFTDQRQIQAYLVQQDPGFKNEKWGLVRGLLDTVGSRLSKVHQQIVKSPDP